MPGSLRQRGPDSWQLRVYLGTDAETGRERWASTTAHGSRRHATARLAEFVEAAGYAQLRAGTVEDLLERWFEAASPGWAASTVRQTRSIIDCHLVPHLGHLPVAKLTTVDVDDFYSFLLRAGHRGERPLATGTVHRVHVVLHRALAQAVRWGWVWLNPASTANPPRVPPPEVRPPAPAQVAALLDAVRERNDALYAYLSLAVSTGARRSQLLALRWAEVDFAHDAVAFTRALVEGQHGPVLRATKTHRTYRVELDRDTLEVLIAYRASAELAARGGLRARSRRVRVQRRRRLCDAVVAQVGHKSVRQGTTRRQSAALPAPRPTPLHDDSDARRRRADRDGLSTALPRPSVDDAQRLRPRRPGQ
jgi:integrase